MRQKKISTATTQKFLCGHAETSVSLWPRTEVLVYPQGGPLGSLWSSDQIAVGLVVVKRAPSKPPSLQHRIGLGGMREA